jgi:hypothetical protein
MQVLTLVEEIQHARPELLAILLRPMIRVPCLTLPPNLKTLLQILPLRSPQLLNLLRISTISDLLASLSNISAIRLWRCPRKSVLLAQRALEELRRLCESFLHDWLGDSVVAEVDEASVLEAFENGAGGGELGFGACGGGEESGEVDEGDVEGVVRDGGGY